MFEVEGQSQTGLFESPALGAPRALANGVVEHVVSGPVAADPALELRLIVRLAPGSPVVRFRSQLGASEPRTLTRAGGKDALAYLSGRLLPGSRAVEVGLSEFGAVLHSFHPSERPIRPSAFEDGLVVPGPILVAEGGESTALFAYEHGCRLPDSLSTPDGTRRPGTGRWTASASPMA